MNSSLEVQQSVKQKHGGLIVGNLIARARREGRMLDDMSTNEILKLFLAFRGGLGDLLCFDWGTIPLMYTQVR